MNVFRVQGSRKNKQLNFKLKSVFKLGAPLVPMSEAVLILRLA